MWALMANNQKAKLIFKCAGLVDKLQENMKIVQYCPDPDVKCNDIEQMQCVLNILQDADRK